jgi:hypothetical protein
MPEFSANKKGMYFRKFFIANESAGTYFLREFKAENVPVFEIIITKKCRLLFYIFTKQQVRSI